MENYSGTCVPTREWSSGINLPGVAALSLVLASALLLVFSFPPFDAGFLAWFALVPMFVALDGRSRASSFLFFWLLGTVFCIGIGSWMAVAALGFTIFDLVLPGLGLGLYYAVFGLGLAYCRVNTQLPLVMTAPALWVTMEFLRSQIGVLEMPWGLLSHTQYRNLAMIQIASFTSAHGVTCLLVVVNAFFADALLWLLRSPHANPRASTLLRYAVGVVIVVALTYVYGLSSLSQEESQERISVTVIQGNIPVDLKSDPSYRVVNAEKHMALSRQATEQQPARLIAWPELAVQGDLFQDLRLVSEVSKIAIDTGSYFVIGTSQRPKASQTPSGGRKKLNSAYLISPHGAVVGRYYKMLLFPFGEYVPYRGLVPWPARYATMDDTVPGTEQTLLEIEGIRFAPLICWEPMFPDFVRTFVRRGARFILNITDEAWFGETQTPYQILSMNVFRAVENGIVIARAANTGLSVFIDPHGRITGQVTTGGKSIFVEGFLTQSIPLLRDNTWYTRYGDLFAYSLMMWAAILVGFSFIQGRSSQPTILGRRQ